MTGGGSPWWNPLRCPAKVLPRTVLLLSKLIAIPLLVNSVSAPLPRDPVELVLRIGAWIAAAALLCNLQVRWAALALGAWAAWSDLFVPAVFLVLAGLHPHRSQPLALQWLLAVVWLVAGLSGASQQFALPSALGWPAYSVFWWPLILLSFAASIGLFVPALQYIGIPAAALIAAAPLLITGARTNLHVYTLAAGLFAYLPSPRQPLLVLFDGDCGFCDFSREWISRFDYDGRLGWMPYQSGTGHAYGISDERAQQRLQLVTAGAKVLEGFHAIRHMIFYLPAVWIILFLALAVSPDPVPRLLAAAVLLGLSPLANGFGTRAYDWVARNRHRLFPGRACAMPPRNPNSSL